MDAIRTMFAADVVSSSLASAFVIMNGNRYLLFQAKKLKADATKQKKEVGILGRTSKGNKATSVKYSLKMTIYNNTDLFTEMIQTYKKTGEDLYFDLQVTNEDPTSKAGRRSVILKDCNLDTATIAAFDVDGDWLEEDVDCTFEDFEVVQAFTMLDGMNA